MELAEFVDLFVASRGLFAELVARDVQDFQAFFVVFLVELFNRRVLRGEAASGRRIDDEDDFPLEGGEVERLAFAGRDFVVVDHFSFLSRFLWRILLSGLSPLRWAFLC